MSVATWIHIFWSEGLAPHDEAVPQWLRHFHFDPDRMRAFDPDYVWRGQVYFCAGVYACRRNVITFAEWMQVEAWAKQDPQLFGDFGDMGPLNYLVHAKAQRGEITVAASDLQQIWGQHGKDELIRDCAHSGWRFPTVVPRPRIAHFCGRKPFVFDRHSYSRPFTIARMEHHRKHLGETGPGWRSSTRRGASSGTRW